MSDRFDKHSHNIKLTLSGATLSASLGGPTNSATGETSSVTFKVTAGGEISGHSVNAYAYLNGKQYDVVNIDCGSIYEEGREVGRAERQADVDYWYYRWYGGGGGGSDDDN